jgi:hypothetical protein
VLLLLLGVVWILASATPVGALPVTTRAARLVAENTIRQHVATFGSWGGATNPVVGRIEIVESGADRLAYNVAIRPSGHVLVAADDEFSPVLLYSDTSTFEAARATEPNAVESWIVPEIRSIYAALRELRRTRPVGERPREWIEGRIPGAWNRFAVPGSAFTPIPGRPARKVGGEASVGATQAASTTSQPPGAQAAGPPEAAPAFVGPLLTTSWAQGASYNNYTPADGACTHTQAGCVAVAAAQLMRYWLERGARSTGVGGHSYVWTGQTLSQTLTASFDHTYDWTQMPGALTGSSTAAEVEATARLIADVAVGVEMQFGCSSSSAYTSDAAASVLPAHFGYKPTTGPFCRTTDPTQGCVNVVGLGAGEFFTRIQQELDAAPPRPVLMAMTDGVNGHSVVLDGYQTGTPEYVHVNLGWGAAFEAGTTIGGYKGWYDVDNNWTATYNWVASTQRIYTGIEPDPTRTRLTVSKSGSGSGRISSSSDGINCGAGCAALFAQGATATLIADPDAGSRFYGWGGDCGVAGTVTLGADRSCTARFEPGPDIPLADAVDQPTRTFATAGSQPWHGQDGLWRTGGSAAKAGRILDSQFSAFETTVVGPAWVSFYWKVSSEAGFDILSLRVDGIEQGGAAAGISGEVDWARVQISVPAGSHVVRWQYTKDTAVSHGSDTAWVDTLVIQPATLLLTDDPLAAGTTVKAVHVRELRDAIDMLRVRYGLAAVAWTDPLLTPGVTSVKAAHLTELRAALDEVFSAAVQRPPTYTDPTIVGSHTVIAATQIAELRTALKSLW